MSDKLPDIPTPDGQQSTGPDPIADTHAGDPCPLCPTGKMQEVTRSQWVRGYGGYEIWLTNVELIQCDNCNAEIFHSDTLDYFERARNGEIPNLHVRPFDPEKNSHLDPGPE